MKWLDPSITHGAYQRLKIINEQVFRYISVGVYGCIYIAILPWFSVFVKKAPPIKRTNWQPWTLHSNTLEDVKKQY